MLVGHLSMRMSMLASKVSSSDSTRPRFLLGGAHARQDTRCYSTKYAGLLAALLLLGYPELATEHKQPLVRNGNGWERPLAHGPPVHHPKKYCESTYGGVDTVLQRLPATTMSVTTHNAQHTTPWRFAQHWPPLPTALSPTPLSLLCQPLGL